MEQCICTLAEHFQADPMQFFHEKEVHSEFFGVGRTALGMAQTNDEHDIQLLRQDYNTLWRYHRAGENGFADRFGAPGEGYVGEIDFVLLRKSFVEAHQYLAVMNKEEVIRRELRRNLWQQNELSPIIERGLEFKMAHVHPVGPPPRQPGVTVGRLNFHQINLDCRKLACERVGVAYSVVLTHLPYGQWLNEDYVTRLFTTCVQSWTDCFDGPGTAIERLRLLLVSPNQCFRWGGWEVAFPTETIIQLGNG